MEEGHDVKASLSISMQTLDITNFASIITRTKVQLDCLQETNGKNIFHEIASNTAKEQYLLQYFDILINEFHERYFEDAKGKIIKMINSAIGREKETPIMMALRNNRSVRFIKKLIKEFISNGANPRIKNANGKGLVHIAAECGFEYMLAYFCRALKLSYKDTDINGRTPLHIAALEGQTHAAIMLISWEEDINSIDIEGFTPLHLAAISQNYKIARNLLLKKADTTVKDNKNETALDIALNRDSEDIVKLLVTVI